ncbi:MAG: hypothetical protein WD535_01125 [Thermaerobacterales bacterium]
MEQANLVGQVDRLVRRTADLKVDRDLRILDGIIPKVKDTATLCHLRRQKEVLLYLRWTQLRSTGDS